MQRDARRRPARRLSRGAALVELLGVAPVLALMIGMAVEFAHLFSTYNTLTKAVRSATRPLTLTDSTSNSGTPTAAWTQAMQQACRLAVYGNLDGSGTPLLPGLTSSMVEIDTSIKFLSGVYGNSAVGCGTTCGISWVRVTINGYRYTPILGSVLPSSALQGDQLVLEPVSLTMRSWPFASTAANFSAKKRPCDQII